MSITFNTILSFHLTAVYIEFKGENTLNYLHSVIHGIQGNKNRCIYLSYQCSCPGNMDLIDNHQCYFHRYLLCTLMGIGSCNYPGYQCSFHGHKDLSYTHLLPVHRGRQCILQHSGIYKPQPRLRMLLHSCNPICRRLPNINNN